MHYTHIYTMPDSEKETNINNLTPRETEIMRLIADGFTNSMIADKLCISTNTVHNHRVSIFKKLNAHNIATMIKAARQLGMIK